ncbi:Melibiose/raffinose/stachyose import permease protein MelC [Paenibacillus solanacearum]|uniref:Melibiose/raffinose/stachyose import permease protein MelC n=1 Tax=Paenibacillus solanacearum TaxID=2048548 RepID=A0A916K1X1_9BACL|nr:carbohydrate ABC transporter permease [Paenibacillus solanacearum]CAG7627424.1 Melibiose/raffinose/stachyose import permease protein MelC [Paenibacillus solanacearum]
MNRERYRAGKLLLELGMIVLAIAFFFPLYLTFINGMKTYNEVVTSTVALPHIFQFKNFAIVWKQINFLGVFMNSLIITVFSVVGILLISSAAAYQLVRWPGRVSQAIFLIILSSLVIPFQTMMIPLVKVAKDLHLINTLYGIVMMYWGFGIPLALFLYHGFIKSIPRELEEAAHIDGSGPVGVFFRILLPLLKPITTTIAILHSLWIWNDFLLPLITLSSKKNQTIPLASSVYFGQYTNEWHLAMAALTMAVIPVMLFFLLMQRYIIQGITAGAVKG